MTAPATPVARPTGRVNASVKPPIRLQPSRVWTIARTELTSSIEFLCMADADQMGRLGKVGPFELTAEEIGELLLCGHLELHVDQLERSLGACWKTAAP